MSAVTRSLKMCWKALPIRFRAMAKHTTDLVRLDYPARDLMVHVTSLADLGRAASCRKEPGTIRWIEERVQGVFYDIGANVGAYSLVAWAHSGGQTRVVAFEPGLSTFPQLCRNLLVNGCAEDVIPLNVALSDRSELKEFRYGDLDSGAAQHVGLEASGQVGHRPVQFVQPMWVYSLDDAVAQFRLPEPNHIKIDVDGHELAILRGARATLALPSLQSLQIEVDREHADTPEIQALLESAGFRLAAMTPHKGDRLADFVFERPEKNS